MVEITPHKNSTSWKNTMRLESRNPMPTAKEITKITYKQYIDDIIGFSTKLLDLGLYGKRIAIISHNKYPWPVSYMAIQTGGMIGVPLDYQLPINEIELSLIRSNAEAVIFEEHFIDTFKKLEKMEKQI